MQHLLVFLCVPYVLAHGVLPVYLHWLHPLLQPWLVAMAAECGWDMSGWRALSTRTVGSRALKALYPLVTGSWCVCLREGSGDELFYRLKNE
jgi:hypothetical protein